MQKINSLAAMYILSIRWVQSPNKEKIGVFRSKFNENDVKFKI